jgi:hypothetical protein
VSLPSNGCLFDYPYFVSYNARMCCPGDIDYPLFQSQTYRTAFQDSSAVKTTNPPMAVGSPFILVFPSVTNMTTCKQTLLIQCPRKVVKFEVSISFKHFILCLSMYEIHLRYSLVRLRLSHFRIFEIRKGQWTVLRNRGKNNYSPP